MQLGLLICVIFITKKDTVKKKKKIYFWLRHLLNCDTDWPSHSVSYFVHSSNYIVTIIVLADSTSNISKVLDWENAVTQI
jgi:hypothetical protein